MLDLDPADLATRRWMRLPLVDADIAALSAVLVQFIALDPTRGVWRGMGNGFIVGGHERSVFVFTAAHVLADSANLILGAERPSALDHLESGAERFSRRVQPLLSDGTIKCIVHFGGQGPEMCNIAYVEVPSDYRKGDSALVMIDIPALAHQPRIGCLPIDVEPRGPADLVIAVAFADITIVPQDVVSSNLGDGTFVLLTGADLQARVGFSTDEPEGAASVRSPLIRTTMPIPAGYSGGPLLAKRRTTSEFVALPNAIAPSHTAIGVLSYDASPECAERDESVEGTSYAMPALSLFRHSVPSAEGLLRLPDAVQRGWINTRGERARRVCIEETPPERHGSVRIVIR